MALPNLTLYRPGQKQSLARLARLMTDQSEARLQQSLWGEDGNQKTVTINIELLHTKTRSELIQIYSEDEKIILRIQGNPELYQELADLLKETLTYRTFTRHSILRFLAQHHFQLDYTC